MVILSNSNQYLFALFCFDAEGYFANARVVNQNQADVEIGVAVAEMPS